ncbi:carbohydrate ABC transporter permease [Paenibacillus tepidiphilus]|uniref:carbohydrate ABC transporter permease n=1 Tax=Paenibacillus tepidiphilus TaxID=2608683 RepID=UPI00123BE1C8|nr:carbohydrate ABC transporter permease [Paenibacillus tepidiphilus]
MVKHRLQRNIQYGILVVLGLCFLVPLFWILLASFDTHAQQGIKMPNFTLDNFSAVLGDSGNLRSFGVGIILSGGQATLVVIASVLAAYPLSRYEMRFKKSFLLSILFMTSLPITAVMVPVFQMFLYFKLQNSIFATMLFLTASSLPYGIWMMKSFMDSVPIDLEEAAWIDGASVWGGLRKVVAPLMLPGIATIAIFTFSGSWGNFFVPYILLQTPDKLPASVTIYQFFGSHGLVEYGRLAAFSLLYTMPSVVLYMFSQRYMSKGFSMGGATKG